MPLKDLIATPGEIAASRITRNFDFSSHEAHSRLFKEIKEAVDSAVAAAIRKQPTEDNGSHR
ncbi:MAG TPA: hypothetical protein V6C97_26985 [Oculatellaceae cyanobacterium]